MPRKKKFLSPAFLDVHAGHYQSDSLDNAAGLRRSCDPLHKGTVPIHWGSGQVKAVGHQAVVPVFLPFRGCPVRCVFCAQDVQTGLADAGQPRAANQKAPGQQASNQQADTGIAAVLREARQNLRHRHEGGQPPAELAFYGGTFTALPEQELAACLDVAHEALEMGWISSFRCSTRPDRVDAATLERLRAAGCGVVELGVQSFADSALAASRRGYTGATALAACASVLEAGLKLGVQLLPGMPGHTPRHFAEDVPAALAAGADMLRFYPCLVLEGTGMAGLWRAGAYEPWDMESTLDALARGWLLARAAGTPVIRMGLAPEASLAGAVLDGPCHPALGARVMSRALFMTVRDLAARELGGRLLARLEAPRACQGYFWGHGNELRPAWAGLGLGPRNVRYGADPVLRLWPRP